MGPTFPRFFATAALIALCTLTHAQGTGNEAGPGTSDPTAFDIQFQAPDAIAQLLERHMELQRYRVLSDLSDTEIQSLLSSARQDASDLLATLGYFSADIQIRLLPPTATGRKQVLIAVAPGAQARVRAVDLVLEGAIAQDDKAQALRQSIRDLWSLASGERFSQDAWDSAKVQALKQMLAKRYATASLQSSQAEVDPDTASVDLQLKLDSGPAYQIGSLDVQGSQRYGDDLVRRFARLQPGEDYELANLVQAQQRLTDSGYFDSAYLTLDQTGDPAHAVVHAVVKEASMQKAVFGIGASTDSGARWSAEHTYNQVPGIDWRAVNKITVARDTKTFASDWTSQPSESRWRWAASALFEQDHIGDIDVATQRYRTGRFTTEASLDQSYYLQIEHTDTVYPGLAPSVVNEAASANYAFAWRNFDSTPFPSSGWGLGGELSAGSVLGTQQEPYSRALLHALIYQPLGQGQSNLFAKQHAGRMVYRAQTGGVFVNNATNVPFTQLFLTGGDTTVRGYKYQEIGVTRDGVITADSGRFLATAGIEWQRPVVRNGLLTDWESAVFVDTGAVANRVEDMSFKSGVGVGARWKSPIGPLQIDVAYGLATQAFRLHLNVGFVF
jgi:translocation and assembly module TamA